LGEIGFDTFEEVELGFKAYILSADFNRELLDETLLPYQEMFTFSYTSPSSRKKTGTRFGKVILSRYR